MKAHGVALLAAALLPGPSAYADKVQAGANLSFHGVVVSRWVPGTSADADANVQVVSHCDFESTPTPNGTLLIHYGGTTQVTPLDPNAVPTSTSVHCEVNNFAYGGTDVVVASNTTPGPAAVASGTVEWSSSKPVTICVSSDVTALGGGTASNPRTCRVPDAQASLPAGVTGFSCVASLPSFGTGTTENGTCGGTMAGTYNGDLHATFTYTEPVVGCPLLGTANGSLTGAIAADFAWTRVGATAVITLGGAHTGTGVASFVVTSPVGNPCGLSNVTAYVAGTLQFV